MATVEQLITAEEYAALPDSGKPTELVRGQIVTMNPPRLRHGLVCGNAYYILRIFAKRHACGRVFSNDSGVITERDPDTVRGADVAYYSYAALPKGQLPGYSTKPPEVIVEVLSPDDRPGRIAAKVQEYLNIGVANVVVLDPEAELAFLYRPQQTALEFTADMNLTLPALSAEFSVKVADFFEDP